MTRPEVRGLLKAARAEVSKMHARLLTDSVDPRRQAELMHEFVHAKSLYYALGKYLKEARSEIRHLGEGLYEGADGVHDVAVAVVPGSREEITDEGRALCKERGLVRQVPHSDVRVTVFKKRRQP